MFADDGVDAIITLRGGYGSARILPYLDYNQIRKNPKVITTDEVDRSLSHLWLAGTLQQAAGIVFGQCVDISYLPTWAKRFTLEEVLAERCLELSIPAISGLMIGHIDDFTTVPIGCEAELDEEARTLTLLEQAVL